MRLRRRHILVTAVAAPAIAVLVAWIGFFNIGASSGHWRITEWFLELAMRSAIRTYALAVDAPDALPKDALIPAAGHYAEGCAFCHGAGGVPRNPAVRAMLPVPPDLSATVDEWTDAQLFRIIKHGIRFTGMPAWPTQTRDDEVWMMVAFLRALPEFDSNDYRRAGHRRRRYDGTACPLHRLPRNRWSRRRRTRADLGRAKRDLFARKPDRLCRGRPRQWHHAAGGQRFALRRVGGTRKTLRRLAAHGVARAPRPTSSARLSSQPAAARPMAFPPASIATPATAIPTSPPSPGSEPNTSPRSSNSSAPEFGAAPLIDK